MWQKLPGSFVLETRSTTTVPSVAIRPNRPVTGISAEDIEAFLRWRSRRDGVAWRLPTPHEWILAAQGGDGRQYPWGDHPDLSLCASALAAQHWSTELVVGCVATDRSVQGIFDLAGGVSEFTSGVGSTERLRVVMGGNYLDRQPERFQTCSRREWDVRIVYEAGGFRLAMSLPKP
jgi:serine/threonine-protein kinase